VKDKKVTEQRNKTTAQKKRQKLEGTKLITTRSTQAELLKRNLGRNKSLIKKGVVIGWLLCFV